ncbi:MAG: c(7)-type cytochrome triheme domain-containing protein [Gammaproteobacteria bacterium]
MQKNRKQNHMNKFFSDAFIIVCGLIVTNAIQAAGWKSLQEDGLHDPESPALSVLQDPTEALSVLPPDTAGNMVNWVEALEGNYIQPRSQLLKEGQLEVLDSTILFKETGDTPYVLFPHRPHTQWLECSNCHEQIFKSEAGATPIDMLSILQGKLCGRCHGAVSFPLTECNRCHSVEIE